MEKSPDAFRTISEVAEHLETPAHVLRFWESRFPQIKPVKRAGGRRYYRPSDVALLAGIKRLLHDEGMTIRGVQKMLREQGVRQVAALAGDGAGLDEIFAVDERLLEGVPGVGPEPAVAEVLSFQAAARARAEALPVTALDLGGAEETLPERQEPSGVEVEPAGEAPIFTAEDLDWPIPDETVHPAAEAESEEDGPAEASDAAVVDLVLAGMAVETAEAAEEPVAALVEDSAEAPFVDTEAEPDWDQSDVDEPAVSVVPLTPRGAQGDLWSAAGLTPPPLAPPRDAVIDDEDDLLEIDLHPVMPLVARLRGAGSEALSDQAEALVPLRDRLLALREQMAAAARVRSR